MSSHHKRFLEGPPLPPGTRVRKVSSKPFKHGGKISTIKSIVEHPYLSKQLAYTFEEDNSTVHIAFCIRAEE